MPRGYPGRRAVKRARRYGVGVRKSVWLWILVIVVVIVVLGLIFGGYRKGEKLGAPEPVTVVSVGRMA